MNAIKTPPISKIPRGKNAPRTKNGCLTCRGRHIKCDEVKPVCTSCHKRKLECRYQLVENWGSKYRDYKFKYVKSCGKSVDDPERAVKNDLVEHVFINGDSAIKANGPINRKKAFLDFIDNHSVSKGERDEFFKYFPLPISQEEIIAIQQYTIGSSLVTSKSYKYCFSAMIIYISTLHPLLSKLLLAVSLGHVGKIGQATRYYYEGLAEFTAFINSMDTSNSDITIFISLTAMWLLIQYHIYYPSDSKEIQKHFVGFSALVETKAKHSLLMKPLHEPIDIVLEGEFISGSVISRLILWSTYHDITAACFGLGGVLANLLRRKYEGAIDRLFQRSEDAGHEMWQEVYPYTELFDDIVNNTAIKLYHVAMLLKMDATELQHKWLNNFYDEDLALLAETSIKKASPLLRDISKDSDYQTATVARYMMNKNTATAQFYASALVLLAVQKSVAISRNDTKWLSKVEELRMKYLNLILEIACEIEQHSKPDVALYRVKYPLLVAALETTDPVHHSWIIGHFKPFAGQITCMAPACEALEECKGKGILNFSKSSFYGTFAFSL